ncbi:hypothetical protein CEXT_637801 [Caerostris extrusa]|uniref:Uncharacterized protein n=1 Tax=Caerostris extrusa TaxID=172846 RepID=A0AAV4UIV7_CAEEX|nr:hypothetical protein CEXT_637801 [Caerostris extrusa]
MEAEPYWESVFSGRENLIYIACARGNDDVNAHDALESEIATLEQHLFDFNGGGGKKQLASLAPYTSCDVPASTKKHEVLSASYPGANERLVSDFLEIRRKNWRGKRKGLLNIYFQFCIEAEPYWESVFSEPNVPNGETPCHNRITVDSIGQPRCAYRIINIHFVRKRTIKMEHEGIVGQKIPGKSVWLLNSFRTSRDPLGSVDPSDHLNRYWGPSPTILCNPTRNSSVALRDLLQTPQLMVTFSKFYDAWRFSPNSTSPGGIPQTPSVSATMSNPA